MGYLGTIGFTVVGGRFKQMGKIHYDEVRKRASIIMYGWRQGKMVCRPFAENPPFLHGDIVSWGGQVYLKGAKVPKTRYVWIGRITSDLTKDKALEVYKLDFQAAPLMERNRSVNSPPRLFIFNDDQQGEKIDGSERPDEDLHIEEE